MITISFALNTISSGSLRLDSVTDPKFKTASVVVRILTPYNESDAAALALLPPLLCSANKKYPTDAKLAKRLNELYGASLSGACLWRSDMLELVFSTDFILDEFTLDNESVSRDATEILLDCILDPLVHDNAFDDAEFAMRKRDLLDSIDAEINDKAAYALALALETAYNGEIRSKRFYGSRSDVESLTSQKCYTVYQNLFSKSKMYVSVCSGKRLPDVEKIIVDRLAPVAGNACLPSYYSYSLCKSEPARVTKPTDAKQSNLILAFKTECRDRFVNDVLCAIYGESPTAKLFVNVREKLSLCYYCQSVYSPTKATMFALSAVDNDNVNKATDEIINQLSRIARGNFSYEELSAAKRYLVSLCNAKLDRKGAILDWTFSERISGTHLTVEQAIDKINSVTKDDVVAAAKSFKLDTVFVLEGVCDE